VSREINIPLRKDFLAELASKLVENHYGHQDVVLLPNRRSCRTFVDKLIVASGKKAIILPQILTYSDIATNKVAFLPFCPDMDITVSETLSDMEIKGMVIRVLGKLNLPLSNLEPYLGFLVKFHTYAGNIDELAEVKHAFEFINLVEEELTELGKKLPQQVRKMASHDIGMHWRGNAERKLFAIQPTNSPPYVEDLLGFFAQQESCQLFLQSPEPQDKGKLPPTMIECTDENQEAQVAALIIREALEEKCASIAVICSDRQMVRRLKQTLKKWSIDADDTTDDFLLDSMVASLFLILLDIIAAKQFSLISLLGLLKHPLSIYNKEQELDKIIKNQFRKPANWGNFEEFYMSLDSESKPLLSSLRDTLSSLINALKTGNFASMLNQHWAAFASIYTADQEREDYVCLQQFVGELSTVFPADARFSKRQYASILSTFLASYNYRQEQDFISQLSIMTPQEARLHKYDRIIILGMNEGQFPVIKKEGSLIGSGKEKELGFPSIDAKIAEAASDFAEMLANSSVFLTRSGTLAGREQQPVRFLDNVDLKGEEKYTGWFHQLRKADYQPKQRPTPNPNSEYRPKSISVSGIEKLMRDPYAFYAEYILKLKTLDDIGTEFSNREFGNTLHTLPSELAPKAMGKDEFIAKMQKGFVQAFSNNQPSQLIFWDLHITRIAEWIWEYERIKDANWKSYHELKGTMDFAGIKVTARADRIDYATDGSVEIIDYKTGRTPEKKAVVTGLYPQLPVEALIAQSGGFAIPDAKTLQLKYIQLQGKWQIGKELMIAANLEQTEAGLTMLINTYLTGDHPFFAINTEDQSGKTSKYKHLSRMDEWFAQSTL